MMHVVWVRMWMRMWVRVRVRVRVRGMIMLKTACTARLLSCNETASSPGRAVSTAAAAVAATTASAASIRVVAMNAHVPIQVARLRESVRQEVWEVSYAAVPVAISS